MTETMSDPTPGREVLGFQTEVRQLLQLMIHSLYGNKEIFLRELVSNASDACDRLRFEAITDWALLKDDPDLKIRIAVDEAARTITVSDNGVGMSRDDVIANLGTIARSGTREFLQQLTGDKAKDAHLIGQFGVGFYSSFIVADRVTVVTRKAGLTAEHGIRWESGGEGDYSIETVTREARGTDVILHLREGEDDLLRVQTLKTILRKYSDHITFPILMSDEQVNQASALWARPKSEITGEQYAEFYKHVGHDFEPPLAYTHARVEGKQEYTLLLYIPRRAPFDLFHPGHRHGIKLYVRRVFIMDDAEQLMPAYLRFVRGVIDSSDLPLNVSREILQRSSDVDAIRTASVKRVLGLLEDVAKQKPDDYRTFWKEFGAVVKEGPGEDPANASRIAPLLRFASTRTGGDEQTVSLADYVERMKDGQSKIFYITADSVQAARRSPHLEVFGKFDVEVLLLYDRVDEWLVAHLTEFDGKPLESVTKGDLDLKTLTGGEPAASLHQDEGEFRDLLERMTQALAERASEVKLTDRLTTSPACLVSDRDGMSTHLERLLKSAGQKVSAGRPVLEINGRHPLLQRLKRETDGPRFADWSHVLFDQALLAEGGQLEDPADFVRRLNELLLGLAGESPPRIWTPS
jgi:molecular chaperone HtpG